jgi:DtxR family transcriptional regulator, Mn-dependent transcriptional regulator
LTAQGLIDTTEMYLRTIFELEEEGVTPLRARIAERLAQSGPTVSQTVARMERDGLLHVAGDRQLSLSDAGRTLATRVMRKHRLAECLLVDVIKLPWEEVHIEACRWEHVVSENVERRLLELLGYPVRCPHGNLIPGLAELGLPGPAQQRMRAAMDEPGEAMTKAASPIAARAVVLRIGEQIQSDLVAMLKLKRGGIQPGHEVILMAGDDGVHVTAGESVDAMSTDLPSDIAAHIFVSVSSRYQPVATALASVSRSEERA